jgi:uncharacterized membrane protein
MMFAGAAIRQYFVLRHGFKHDRNGNPIRYAVVGILVILGVMIWLAPTPQPTPSTTASTPDTAAILKLTQTRCLLCHGATMQMKNVRLDSEDLINQHAAAIYQQVVVTKQMPMNNATGITPEERQMVANWFIARKP